MARSSEPAEVQPFSCDAQAKIAAILKPTTVDAGVATKGSGEDKNQWLETTQADMDSLVAPITLRTTQPQEVKAVQTKGAPRNAVEHNVCGEARSKADDNQAQVVSRCVREFIDGSVRHCCQNPSDTAMRLALALGSLEGTRWEPWVSKPCFSLQA